MTLRNTFFLLGLGFLFSCAQNSNEKAETAMLLESEVIKTKKSPTENAQPILVELFTSQGCSSCPPADKVLKEINETYTDKQVIAISFHVDYWNYLGWKDTFSNSEYSQRQRVYNSLLRDGTYTPQMIVDGKYSLVGSKKGQVLNRIEQALNSAHQTEKTIEVSQDINGNDVSIQYQIGNLQNDENVQFALIEKQSTVKIGRGENGGREITYHNIVRDFKTSLKENGDIKFNTKNITDYFILMIIQNKKGNILFVEQIT